MLANTENIQDINSNEDSYAGLVSMIDISQGMMVLIIASCASEFFRDEIIERYETELAKDMPSYKVKLDRSEPSLRAALENLVNEQPELKRAKVSAVISVTGASNLMSIPVREEETNSALDRFFGYLQWTREGLREFPFPIVLWVTPKILKQLSAKAPDFWSWRGGVFQFSTSPVLSRDFAIKEMGESRSILEQSINNLEIEELLVRIDQIEQQYPISLSLATLFDRVGQAYTNRPVGNHIENNEKAIEHYQKSIVIQTALNSKQSKINTLRRLANLYRSLDRYQEAKETCEKCLTIEIELGYRLGEANSLACLGYITRLQDDWDKARELYEHSLQIYTELNDHLGVASSLALLGKISYLQGDFYEAQKLYENSLQICTELNNRSGIAIAWSCLGENELAMGNLKMAEVLMKKALAVMEDLPMTDYIAETYWDLARLYRSKPDHQKAQEHYEIAHQLFTQLGAKKDLEKIEANWNSALK